MSAPPQASGGGRLETNMNPCPPRSGEGQKSLYSLLIGSPTLTGAPKGPSGLARPATQMSRPPSPPGRFEAMYNCSPSRERIGQPSRNGVFSSELVPGTDSRLTAGPQAENEGAASAGAATSRSRALASTPTSSASATTIKNLCLFIFVSPSLADGVVFRLRCDTIRPAREESDPPGAKRRGAALDTASPEEMPLTTKSAGISFFLRCSNQMRCFGGARIVFIMSTPLSSVSERVTISWQRIASHNRFACNG